MRSIVEGGTENIRSKPATAGLPPWGALPIPLISAKAMPKFHEWKIKYCASDSDEFEHNNQLEERSNR